MLSTDTKRLEDAYGVFNREYFNGELPMVMITIQSSLKALTPWNLAGFLYHCKRQYISVLEAGLFFHGRSSDYYLQHTLHITGRNRYIIFSTIKEFIYDI